MKEGDEEKETYLFYVIGTRKYRLGNTAPGVWGEKIKMTISYIRKLEGMKMSYLSEISGVRSQESGGKNLASSEEKKK